MSLFIESSSTALSQCIFIYTPSFCLPPLPGARFAHQNAAPNDSKVQRCLRNAPRRSRRWLPSTRKWVGDGLSDTHTHTQTNKHTYRYTSAAAVALASWLGAIRVFRSGRYRRRLINLQRKRNWRCAPWNTEVAEGRQRGSSGHENRIRIHVGGVRSVELFIFYKECCCCWYIYNRK